MWCSRRARKVTRAATVCHLRLHFCQNLLALVMSRWPAPGGVSSAARTSCTWPAHV
jgi:hypothetical protein